MTIANTTILGTNKLLRLFPSYDVTFFPFKEKYVVDEFVCRTIVDHHGSDLVDKAEMLEQLAAVNIE